MGFGGLKKTVMDEKIKNYVESVAKNKGKEIDLNTDLFAEFIFDSLEIILFIEFLKTELNMEISVEDLKFENFQSLESIMSWINSNSNV